jgi:hypothetical protein
MNYNVNELISLGGEWRISKTNKMEFYVDELQLQDVLLEVFYDRME